MQLEEVGCSFEIGNWEFETRSWKLENRNWQMETIRSATQVSSFQFPVSKLREAFLAGRIDANTLQLKDQVVSINRVTKVVKGGKNLSFSALVVVGDGAGHVGYGSGKAREVPMAIRKGIEAAKKALVKVNITSTSIPHAVLGKYGAGQVLLKPASEGTGVIAGGTVRAVVEAAGIQNVLTKSLGTTNPHNVVKATMDALLRLRDAGEVAATRGKTPEEL